MDLARRVRAARARTRARPRACRRPAARGRGTRAPGPSRSAASSSRPASGCSEKRANVLTDLLRDLLGRARRRRRATMRSGCRAASARYAVVDAAHELVALALDPVVVAAARAPARLVGIEQHEERAVGQQAAGHRAGSARSTLLLAERRARRPGRRPTSRCSGRRRRPRRARAPAGSRARRARRAPPRRAPPRPTASSRRRAARGRAPPRRPACRPARGSRAPCVPRSRSHSASSSACVLFPDQSTPSKVTNIDGPNLRPRCGRSSQAVRASSGRTSSTPSSTRGDDVTVVDNFASGKRENLNPAATLLEHDIREPFSVDADVVFHLAAQADVQTSMKRPEYDAAVNVVGTVNVLAGRGRRAGDLRVLGRRGLRRVRRAGDRGGAVPAALAVRDREEVRRGVPRRLEPHPRDARTSRSASRTSTGRARTRASRAASSRSSSSGMARGEETVDLRRRRAEPRLRLRRRRRRRAARGGRHGGRARTTSAPAADTTVARAARRLRTRRGQSTPSRGTSDGAARRRAPLGARRRR